MLILVGCTYQAVRQQSEDIMSKTEFYADLNRDFQALMAGETSFLAMIANTSALLFERLSEVNWAGFYLLEGDTLVLGPFQGKLACVRLRTLVEHLEKLIAATDYQKIFTRVVG